MIWLDILLLPVSLPCWCIAKAALQVQAELIIKPPRVFVDEEIWRIQWAGGSRIDEVRVPTAELSDGLSAPKIVRRWWHLAQYDAAGRLHDHIYASGRYSRRTSDMILYEAAVAIGVPEPRAALMWLMVRWCAKSHYKTT